MIRPVLKHHHLKDALVTVPMVLKRRQGYGNYKHMDLTRITTREMCFAWLLG